MKSALASPHLGMLQIDIRSILVLPPDITLCAEFAVLLKQSQKLMATTQKIEWDERIDHIGPVSLGIS